MLLGCTCDKLFDDHVKLATTYTLVGVKDVCIKWFIKRSPGASLVAQWLRICLPMQGTRVRALVREDPTCGRAARPVSHNY